MMPQFRSEQALTIKHLRPGIAPPSWRRLAICRIADCQSAQPQVQPQRTMNTKTPNHATTTPELADSTNDLLRLLLDSALHNPSANSPLPIHENIATDSQGRARRSARAETDLKTARTAKKRKPRPNSPPTYFASLVTSTSAPSTAPV